MPHGVRIRGVADCGRHAGYNTSAGQSGRPLLTRTLTYTYVEGSRHDPDTPTVFAPAECFARTVDSPSSVRFLPNQILEISQSVRIASSVHESQQIHAVSFSRNVSFYATPWQGAPRGQRAARSKNPCCPFPWR